jgi:MFS family permease
LRLQGRREEALAVLRATLQEEEAAKVEAEWLHGAATECESVASWGEVLCPAGAKDRRSVKQGVGVAMAQMASGITVLLYYSDYILTHDLGHSDAFLGMVLVASAKLVVLVLSCLVLDHVGRRPMLLLSSGLMSLALSGLGACYLMGAAPWTKVLVLACCIACFSVGLGGGAYVVVSEVFSNRLRARGSAIAFCASRCLAAVTNFSFPFLAEAVSMGGAFLIYSGMCFLGFLFIFTCVEETAGRTLEALEREVAEERQA